MTDQTPEQPEDRGSAGTPCWAACPFCGSDPPDLMIDIEDDEGTRYGAAAKCLDCDASGPATGWYKDKSQAAQSAIDLWNQRTG